MMVRTDSLVTRADAARLEESELIQLRKQAAQRLRRIIYNDDGSYVRPFDTPEKFYKARLQQVVNTQVDTVFYCTGVTTLFSHLTEVGEIRGEFVTEDDPPHARRIRDAIQTLREAGYDTLRLQNQLCRQHNIECFFSLRMNDTHDSYSWGEGLLCRWKREHPEYLMGEVADRDKYPESSPRFNWSALNYEIPEVRDYIFRILEDVCQRYDVDGIELDWWRDPMAFLPTHHLESVEPRHLAIMNDFMRRLRKMTEQVGQQRGRPLLIAARVPLSVDRCLAIGLDVVTWLRDDLCDILSVGDRAPMAMAPQVQEMAQFTHRYGVPLYGCISGSNMEEQHSSVEAWRGAAMNIWHAGADGVYTFNFFPGEPAERLSQLGSPETLKGLDKIYGVDCIVAEEAWGNGRPGLVVPNRLPVELQVNGWSPVHLPVGENIAANAPAGKTTHATLRLRISSLAAGDEVRVKLNGQQLGSAVPAEALGNEPTTAWMELEPDPGLVQEGDNLVEVQLTAQRALAELPMIDRLDLVVRYQ